MITVSADLSQLEAQQFRQQLHNQNKRFKKNQTISTQCCEQTLVVEKCGDIIVDCVTVF